MPLTVLIAVGAAAAAGGGAYYYVTHRKGVLTPDRKSIFDAAMSSLSNANELRKLADVFDSEGLPDQAAALRLKAQNLEMTPTKKAAYKEAAKAGLSVTNPAQAAAVQNLANQFRNQGATQTASVLDQHAQDLTNGQGAYAPKGRGTTAPDPVYTPTASGAAADVVVKQAVHDAVATTPIVRDSSGGRVADSGADGGFNGDTAHPNEFGGDLSMSSAHHDPHGTTQEPR